MTGFDELVGAEPTGAERERLRDVHNLLLQAGPPPELSPELASGPTLAMTLGRIGRIKHRRPRYVLIATAAAFVVLLAGIVTGLHGHGSRYPTITMHGTSFAVGATGSLELLPSTGARQRMQLDVKGLPALGKQRYVVYLVRNGRLIAPCGSFSVPSTNRSLKVELLSPYRVESSDTWVVTAPKRGSTGPGVTVLRELT